MGFWKTLFGGGNSNREQPTTRLETHSPSNNKKRSIDPFQLVEDGNQALFLETLGECNPEALDNDGWTLLLRIIWKGEDDWSKSVAGLLDAGANPNRTAGPQSLVPLVIACDRGCPRIVEVLLSFGADPALEWSHRGDSDTPLAAATGALSYAPAEKVGAYEEVIAQLNTAQGSDTLNDADMKSGAVKYIVIVSDTDLADINMQVYLESLLPEMKVSYKHDVAEDCRILTIEDVPQNWNRERLNSRALEEWRDLDNRADLIYEGYTIARTMFGAAWLLLIREQAHQTQATNFRYPDSLFPWETQLSFTIWENDDKAFSKEQIANLQDLLDASELTYTTGYEPEIHHAAKEASFGPFYVQFYNSEELHQLWTKISSWVTENNGELISTSPVKCSACNHYNEHKYQPCMVCQEEV